MAMMIQSLYMRKMVEFIIVVMLMFFQIYVQLRDYFDEVKIYIKKGI